MKLMREILSNYLWKDSVLLQKMASLIGEIY